MGHKHLDKKKKKTNIHLHKGVLEVTRSGMGFVIAKGLDRDVLVRPNDFNTAMHGDSVLVKITQSKRDNSRIQGIVESVIERKQTDFPGHIQMGEGFAFFIAETARPMTDVYIPLDKLNGAKDSDRVIIRINRLG